MRVMELVRPAAAERRPLQLAQRDEPAPAAGELLVAVEVCGVCRTDLHVAEGDLAVHRPGVVPGHEVVGRVSRLGPGASRFAVGDRVGVAWLHRACGVCRFCRASRENLCLAPTFTGWDADGGYADYAVVPEDFAYGLPAQVTPHQAAPLL